MHFGSFSCLGELWFYSFVVLYIHVVGTHSAPFESFYSFEIHKINIHYAYFTMDYKDVTRNVPYET